MGSWVVTIRRDGKTDPPVLNKLVPLEKEWNKTSACYWILLGSSYKSGRVGFSLNKEIDEGENSGRTYCFERNVSRLKSRIRIIRTISNASTFLFARISQHFQSKLCNHRSVDLRRIVSFLGDRNSDLTIRKVRCFYQAKLDFMKLSV